MLESFRKFAMSPFGKVIFVLVLIAFGAGFWYVGDPFKGGGEWAVSVGDIQIRPQTVSDQYRRELQSLRAQRGGKLTAEQAKAMGLPQQVVGTLVNRVLFDTQVADLGLTASDDEVRRTIQSNPAFFGPGGTYDHEILKQRLRSIGMSENGYVDSVRSDLARQQYVESLTAGAAAPEVMADAFYRLINEQRSAQVLRFTPDATAAPPEPDEAALKTYYDAHPDQFTAPEFRTITLVTLRPDDLIDTITVDEDTLQRTYENNLDRFSTPEKRTLRQMILPDEATAKRAYARLKEGGDFATVAKEEAGLAPEALEVGTVERSALVRDVANLAFAAPKGTVTEPVSTLFGWHIVIVDDIIPAKAKPLDEVRDQVRKLAARDMAVERVFTLANQLDDRLGGGERLESAAAALTLTARTVGPFDASGQAPDGNAVPNLPKAVIDTAFAQEAGMDSLLTDLGDDGYFVLRVDTVTPAAVRPLADVRGRVVDAVRAEQRRNRAETAADAALKRLQNSADMATVAADAGLTVETTPPFRRNGEGTDLPPALVRALFGAKPHEAVKVSAGDTVYVAQLEDVTPADPQADSAGVARMVEALNPVVANDLIEQVLGGLREAYPVRVNTAVLDRTF